MYLYIELDVCQAYGINGGIQPLAHPEYIKPVCSPPVMTWKGTWTPCESTCFAVVAPGQVSWA